MRKNLVFLSLAFVIAVYFLAREVNSQEGQVPPSIFPGEPKDRPGPPSIVHPDKDKRAFPSQPLIPSLQEPPSNIVQVPSFNANQLSMPLKNIWSIQIEQVDGKEMIRATIGKKNEIKIMCDQVDLQTQNGVFLARGHVGIAGENVQGQCDILRIQLHEENLILDGQAQVKFFYRSSNEPGNPFFEVSGTRLSLRWPDLQVKSETLPVPQKDAPLPPPQNYVPGRY